MGNVTPSPFAPDTLGTPTLSVRFGDEAPEKGVLVDRTLWGRVCVCVARYGCRVASDVLSTNVSWMITVRDHVTGLTPCPGREFSECRDKPFIYFIPQ